MKYPALSIDPRFRRQLILYFSIAAVFYVLAALFQSRYSHPDQHFQTLEFANLKLHPQADVFYPWEYHEKIRPWLQPYLYVEIIRGLNGFGIDNPFTHERAIRLLSGALGLAANILFCITLSWWLPLAAQKKWLAIMFSLFWALPVLHTRTSAENLSGTFMMLSLAALFLLRRPDPQNSSITATGSGPFTGRFEFSTEGLVLSAICLGLMFQFRYQMGAICAALLLWMLLIARVPIRHAVLFCLVFACITVASIGLDSLGYNSFQIVPWNYFKSNLLDGMANGFGVQPWHFYLTKSLEEPGGVILILCALIFWVTYPLNLLSWMTLLFFVEHSLIGHKEVRFLLPVVHLGLAMFAFLVPQDWFRRATSGNPFTGQARWIKLSFYLVVAINLAMIVEDLARPSRPEIRVQKLIHDLQPAMFEFYSLGPTPYRWKSDFRSGHALTMNFYAPKQVLHHSLDTVADLEKAIPVHRSIYFYHDENGLPDTADWTQIRLWCTEISQGGSSILHLLNSDESTESIGSVYRCARPNPSQVGK